MKEESTCVIYETKAEIILMDNWNARIKWNLTEGERI